MDKSRLAVVVKTRMTDYTDVDPVKIAVKIH